MLSKNNINATFSNRIRPKFTSMHLAMWAAVPVSGWTLALLRDGLDRTYPQTPAVDISGSINGFSLRV